jgi:FtsZ-interacting cell division protein ZipA
MKIDIDSYLYIILMVIILVVSGLGGRRKKRAQKMRPLPSSAQQGTRESEDIEVARPRNPVIDPFERLEQILTGQSRYESMEGESLETLDDEEEAIVDEEEKILAAQDHRQESKRPDPTAETEDEQGKKSLDDLFGDVDEVTRAIIYSEILPRKYI